MAPKTKGIGGEKHISSKRNSDEVPKGPGPEVE